MAPAPNELLIELRDILLDRFTLTELGQLCQLLSVDLEHLTRGRRDSLTLNTVTRELALYLDRHDMIGKLVALEVDFQSSPSWEDILSKHNYIALEDGRMIESSMAKLTKPRLPLPRDVENELVNMLQLAFQQSNRQVVVNRLDFDDLQRIVPILAHFPDFVNPDIRKDLLMIVGVKELEGVDLVGPVRTLSANVLLRLNEIGQIEELVTYLIHDDTLSPSDKRVLQEIATRNGIAC